MATLLDFFRRLCVVSESFVWKVAKCASFALIFNDKGAFHGRKISSPPSLVCGQNCPFFDIIGMRLSEKDPFGDLFIKH